MTNTPFPVLLEKNINHDAVFCRLTKDLEKMVSDRIKLEKSVDHDEFLSSMAKLARNESNKKLVEWTFGVRHWFRTIMHIYADEFAKYGIQLDYENMSTTKDPIVANANYDALDNALSLFTYISNVLLACYLATDRHLFKSMAAVEAIYKIEQIEDILTRMGNGKYPDGFDEPVRQIAKLGAEVSVTDVSAFSYLLSRPYADICTLVPQLVRLTVPGVVVAKSEWVTIAHIVGLTRHVEMNRLLYDTTGLSVVLKGKAYTNHYLEWIPSKHALTLLERIAENIVNNQPVGN